MKNMHKIASVSLLLVLFAGVLVMPAAATSSFSEHDGLEVTIEMDKDRYSPGEPITAAITVENTNTETVMIANLEQLIPEGYQLEPDSEVAMTDVEMWPGRVIVLEVTFVGEPAAEAEAVSGFFDKLLYGETMGIPNLLIAVVLAIGFAVFMILT